jgi:hypothetical protein
MPCGLVRTDLNKTGISYRNGFPILLPWEFGTAVTLPWFFGNPVPPTDPTFNSNPVNWTVNPAHFGNIIGGSIFSVLLLDDGSEFLLDSGGNILLDN